MSCAPAQSGSSQFAAGAKLIQAFFLHKDRSSLTDRSDFIEFDELINDFFADAHMFGRFAHGQQR